MDKQAADVANYHGNAARDAAIRFDLLPPNDRMHARLIARRAVQLIRDMQRRNPRPDWLDPDAMLIEMDVCTLHMRRPMRLQEWLESDDLTFLFEILLVSRIFASVPGLRASGMFPEWVQWRFSRAGVIT